jgi:hypothetical protein
VAGAPWLAHKASHEGMLCRLMEQPEQDAAGLAALTTSCAEQLGAGPSRAELQSRLGEILWRAVR